MTVVVIRRQPCEDSDTKRIPCENEGRDWSNAATHEGFPYRSPWPYK